MIPETRIIGAVMAFSRKYNWSAVTVGDEDDGKRRRQVIECMYWDCPPDVETPRSFRGYPVRWVWGTA